MKNDKTSDTEEGIETKKKVRNCPHCRDRHEVEVVTEPGYERVVFCPRTGDMG